MRADERVAQALNISRNKASELIKAQKIFVGSRLVSKPSQTLSPDEKISCDDEIFVGRGALKLKSFLESQKISVKGKNALDIGSSTGGFAQVLLISGASSVVCVDVGEGQLADSLRLDERVVVRESTDIRDFASAYSGQGFDLITADLSFIPLSLVLPCIKTLANDEIIVLFKPQFEVGLKAKRDKKGVVCDQKAINTALADFKGLCAEFGFKILAQVNCAIKGKNGNQEIFFHLKVKGNLEFPN